MVSHAHCSNQSSLESKSDYLTPCLSLLLKVHRDVPGTPSLLDWRAEEARDSWRTRRMVAYAMGNRKRCAACDGTYHICTDCPDWGWSPTNHRSLNEPITPPEEHLHDSESTCNRHGWDVPADNLYRRIRLKLVRRSHGQGQRHRAGWRVASAVQVASVDRPSKRGLWTFRSPHDDLLEASKKGRPVIACPYHRLVGVNSPDQSEFFPPSCVREGYCRKAEVFIAEDHV